MSNKYWQCPNDESHSLTFKGLPLSARVPYCKDCFGRVSAVFQEKLTNQSSTPVCDQKEGSE